MMKRILFSLAIVALSATATLCAQKSNNIFDNVEEMPRFPVCESSYQDNNSKKSCADQKMMEWLYSRIKYPQEAQDKGIQGTVVITFLVDKDGNMLNLEITKKIGGGCEEEALRVLQEMAALPAKWIPGKQAGKAVSVKYTLPIRFKLPS